MSYILFLNDWKKFPGAVPHLTTRNKTWIELARTYRAMGVKNWFFHLALLDPELEHVDPHDPELDLETKVKVAVEARRNPWYYLREIVRLPPKGGVKPMQYRANRGNVAATWCFLNHITFSNTQPRQTGKSTNAEQLFEWMLDGGTRNASLLLVTKDSGLRDQTIAKIKNSRHLKPAYLWSKHPKDVDNNMMIQNNNEQIKNQIVTAVAQKSKMASNNVGRGWSTPVQWWDEAPFITFLEEAMTSAGPALSAAMPQAKEAGLPYGTILTTTAGDRNTRDGKYYWEMLKGGMIWDEYLLDMSDETALREEVEARCPGIRTLINGTFSHRQLGLTDEWLHATIREVGGTPESIDKDFFNIWGTGGGKSPHSVQVQKALAAGKIEPLYNQRFDGEGYRHYVVRWYLPKDEIVQYMNNNTVVIGIDTSSAVGRDSITMVGIDPKSLKTIFAFNINETNVIRFCDFVANFMVKYPKAVIIPEHKSTGVALVDHLLISLPAKGINPYRRMFNLAIQEADDDKERYNMALSSGHWNSREIEGQKKLFGYTTTGSGKYSRNNLYLGTMSSATSRACYNVKDILLTNELLGLQEKNGRIDHSNSDHDDHVIAWLMAVWWLIAGKNLAVYGIKDQLSETVELDEDSYYTEQARIKRLQQMKIRQQLDELVEQYRSQKDLFMKKSLEAKIRALDKKLEEQQDYGSIGELLGAISSHRTAQHRQRRWGNRVA